jgi:hypothetical protein
MPSPYRKTLEPRVERRKAPSGIEEHIPAGTVLASVTYRTWSPLAGEYVDSLEDVEVIESNYAGVSVEDGARTVYIPAQSILNAEVSE